MTRKILHALVGYLAVTALPGFFQVHPFAFTLPLSGLPAAAIEYDGRVNTTQNHIDGALIKHVLGSIMKTCQTVTYHSGYSNTTQTPGHSDSALMKRVPGDIIEARQAVVIAPAAVAVAALVAVVVLSIVWVLEDNPVSDNDLEFLVKQFD